MLSRELPRQATCSGRRDDRRVASRQRGRRRGSTLREKFAVEARDGSTLLPLLLLLQGLGRTRSVRGRHGYLELHEDDLAARRRVPRMRHCRKGKARHGGRGGRGGTFAGAASKARTLPLFRADSRASIPLRGPARAPRHRGRRGGGGERHCERGARGGLVRLGHAGTLRRAGLAHTADVELMLLWDDKVAATAAVAATATAATAANAASTTATGAEATSTDTLRLAHQNRSGGRIKRVLQRCKRLAAATISKRLSARGGAASVAWRGAHAPLLALASALMPALALALVLALVALQCLALALLVSTEVEMRLRLDGHSEDAGRLELTQESRLTLAVRFSPVGRHEFALTLALAIAAERGLTLAGGFVAAKAIVVAVARELLERAIAWRPELTRGLTLATRAFAVLAVAALAVTALAVTALAVTALAVATIALTLIATLAAFALAVVPGLVTALAHRLAHRLAHSLAIGHGNELVPTLALTIMLALAPVGLIEAPPVLRGLASVVAAADVAQPRFAAAGLPIALWGVLARKPLRARNPVLSEIVAIELGLASALALASALELALAAALGLALAAALGLALAAELSLSPCLGRHRVSAVAGLDAAAPLVALEPRRAAVLVALASRRASVLGNSCILTLTVAVAVVVAIWQEPTPATLAVCTHRLAPRWRCAAFAVCAGLSGSLGPRPAATLTDADHSGVWRTQDSVARALALDRLKRTAAVARLAAAAAASAVAGSSLATAALALLAAIVAARARIRVDGAAN